MLNKSLIITAFFSFILSPSFTQIIVQRSDFPFVGQQIVNALDDDTEFEVGNNGPNQTWDFINAEATSYDTSVYILPYQAPDWQLFPEASIVAFNISSEGGAYGFYEDTGIDLGLRGIDFNMTIMPGMDYTMHTIYKTPDWIHLPYHYGDNYAYSFKKNVYSGLYSNGTLTDSSKVSSHVNGTMEVDAWGTMIIPTGAFPVLRIKNDQNYTDSLYKLVGNSWVLQSINQGSYERYSWMTNQYGIIGDVVVSNSRARNFSFFVSQTIVNTGNYSLPERVFAISPNPAHDFITINTPLNVEKVAIYNLAGELQITVTNHKKINITSLKKGIYFARILSKHETTVVKFVKK